MEGDQAGCSNVKMYTRLPLYNLMRRQNLPTFNDKLIYLENYLLASEKFSAEEQLLIKKKFSHEKFEFKRRWMAAHYIEERFLEKNNSWLQGVFEFSKPSGSAGRPEKSFLDLSERSKRRKTEDLRANFNPEIIGYATQMQLRSEGYKDAGYVVRELISNPAKGTEYKKAIFEKKEKTDDLRISPLKALSMFVEADLSRRQYEIIRNTNKKLYPCNSLLQRAKKDCYPKKSALRVTETCAEIKLQELMDHTVLRLLTYLEDVLELLSEQECSNLVLICKWGYDGSQQSQYKQKFSCEEYSDANIFQSSFVPIKLICDLNKKVIWQNPTPSSPRYCRPIRIRFIKESVDVTKEEISYVENACKSLQFTDLILKNKKLNVKHVMLLTMIDEKVCNAATETSSTMKCYICGATSKDFNNLSLKKSEIKENLKFGLSVLHARIRIFETLLHLSYKLTIKKWRLQTGHEKEIVKARKSQIQEEFRLRLGLLVDIPKAGFGNTNDGNTSRRFFSEPKAASDITGLDFSLIYRFKILLETLSCGFKINTQKFSTYAMDTATLYVELYPWYPMTPTVHKILIHGASVIETALIPIGQLSEEASEARNKHFRLYRQNLARKFSRESCNLDVLNRLLLSSDPLLSSMRPTPRKKSKPFSKETLEMLLPEDPTTRSESENSSSDEESVKRMDISEEEKYSSSSDI